MRDVPDYADPSRVSSQAMARAINTSQFKFLLKFPNLGRTGFILSEKWIARLDVGHSRERYF